MLKQKLKNLLINNPVLFANKVGFDKLGSLHNMWIKWMVHKKTDFTLQAHRNSYKTTCVAVALALIIILKPNERTLFLRKTDDDVKEIIAQVKKILLHPITKQIIRELYNIELILTVDNATEVSTNLCNDTKGTSQLMGMGIKASLTGKHFDNIFTDDIVTLRDRISKPERDAIIIAYQELQNLKVETGRIFNTGTPWHKDDAFKVMPKAVKFTWKDTNIFAKEQIEEKKSNMLSSIFAVNYELRHIASEDVIFTQPMEIGLEKGKAMRGISHLDAAYYGSDFTALTFIRKSNGFYYVYGKLWRKHVEECYNDIIRLYKEFLPNALYCEDNGDKGFVARDLRKSGLRTHSYHETTNKFLKITSILKREWSKVKFVEGTDDLYIEQICEYNENAEHDDAPDSLASSIRRLYRK